MRMLYCPAPKMLTLPTPGQAGELVLQVDRRVVAQEQAVVAAVRRAQGDDLEDRGRLLLGGDALLLDRRRQLGSAIATRFWTSTWAKSGSVPISNVTTSV